MCQPCVDGLGGDDQLTGSLPLLLAVGLGGRAGDIFAGLVAVALFVRLVMQVVVGLLIL